MARQKKKKNRKIFWKPLMLGILPLVVLTVGAIALSWINLSMLKDGIFTKGVKGGIVNVYPSSVEGDWKKVSNSKEAPDVSADGNEDSFSDSNSAIYDGGQRQITFSQFNTTGEDLESKTEQEAGNSEEFKTDDAIELQEKGDEIQQEESVTENEEQIIEESQGAEEDEETTIDEPQDESVEPEEAEETSLLQEALGKKALAAKILNLDQIEKSEFVEAKIFLSFATKNIKAESVLQTPEKNFWEKIEDFATRKAQANSEEQLGEYFDTAVIVKYSVDDENWEEVDFFSEEISNEANKGYFSYDANLVTSWEDLKNLQVKVEGLIEGEVNLSSFLDSVWIQVRYGSDEDSEEKLQIFSEKESWSKNEHPKFKIEDPEMHDSFLEKTRDKIVSPFQAEPDLAIKLTNAKGEEFELEKNEDFRAKDDGSIEVELLPQNDLPPGSYILDVKLEKDGEQQSFEGTFNWGVLAMNFNKSIYLEKETAHVQLAALDEAGHTLCDANLQVEIIQPDLSNKIFRTKNGTIEKSETCGPNNVTDIADYFFYYETFSEGIYEIIVTNLDNDFEISDEFEVREKLPYEVERVGATRINPFEATYEMTFNIDANENFEGSITEKVPISFEIQQNDSFSVSEGDDVQYINWENVEIEKGENISFSYIYQAPKVSPMLFLLGPLRLDSSKSGIGSWLILSDESTFEEARQWQIASDAETAWVVGSGTYTSSDWTSWNQTTLAGDNDVRAEWSSVGTAVGTIDGFNFNIPAGATVDGIQVMIQGLAEHVLCNGYFLTRVSWDGGSTWSTTQQRSPDTGTLPVDLGFDYYEGSSTYLWDHSTWTVDEINNNFVVEVSGYNNKNKQIVGIDLINVKVWYTESTLIEISGTADGSVGETVRVAFDGVLQSELATIQSASPNTWSIASIEAPSSGATITAWIDGVADSAEATAVTKYSGSGNVSGMILDANVLTIGSDQNQSSTVTELNQYDCTEDEDIMHQAASSTLAVEGGSCAGATSNSYTNETIDILASDTLTIGGTETLATDNVEINGTLSSGGNSAYNISGDWTNNSSFTDNTSTITMSGSGTLTSGGNELNNLNLSGTITLANATHTIVGNLDMTGGTITAGTSTVVMNGTSKIYTSGGNTLYNFTPSGTITLANATHSFSGDVNLSGTITAGTSTVVMNGTSKTITSNSQTLNNFEVSGGSISNVDNLDVNGTFTVSGGGFSHGTGVNINVAGDFTLDSGTTFTQPGACDPTCSGTLILDGDLSYADNTAALQSIGDVQIGASPDTTILTTDLKANSVSIPSGDILYTCEYEVDAGNGGVEVSGTLDASASGATNCTGNEGDETLITTAEDFNINSGASFVQDQSTVEFDDTSGTNTLITDGAFSLYNLVINGGTSIIIQVQDPLDVDNNVTITSGALDVVDTENNQITVGGSWSNADEFTARNGLVLFDSADTGETIDSGGTGTTKDFYDIQFNHSGGGWTIQTNNLTAIHDFTITDTAASGFTVNSVTVEVQGTYSVADAEFSNTTWTSATLYLNSATAYTIGSKTQNAETYSTLQVGANTDIRTWESSATTYTVDATSSLYSQDHANATGDLYIWGDYHVNTNDYWSYANDFDGTTSADRQVDVRIDPAAKVTVDSGDTLAVIGTSGNESVVSRQGASNGYEISCLSGGTINFQYASFDYLDGALGLDIQAGSTVTSLDYTDFDNLVGTAGTADAFITVASTVIGSASKTITGVNFDNTGTGAEFNVNRTGADDTGHWDFDSSTGTFDGESYDGDDGADEADPGMLNWDDSIQGINVDGIIYSNEGSSPYLCNTTGNLTIDVRVNGTGSYTAECTADSGAFSVSAVTIGNPGDVVMIFVNENGVGSVYAATVTKAADTTSDITADLYQNHVIIRHEDGGPVTIDNLDYFDSGNDSDVQFTAANDSPDTLTVNDGHELYILGSMTFTPGGNVTVDDIEILGTYTATGPEAILVSGSWVNSGTFTAASSTVTFDATSGAEAINSTGASTATFNNLVLGTGSGTATWNLGSALDVDGDLAIDFGTLGQGTNNITLEGNLAIAAGGNFTSGSGSFTFDGATTPVTWSNAATIDDLGAVVIDETTKTVNLSSSVQANSVSVGADDVLGLGDSGYVLTLSGSGTAGSRPFVVSNAAGLTEGTDSTVVFAGTGDTEIEDETYHHLQLAPAGGAGPNYFLGTAGLQTITVSGNLTIGDGTNAVTVNADTYDPTLDVAGNVVISTNGGALTASETGTFQIAGSWSNSGTFTHSSGTVEFDSDDAGETISDGGSAFNDLLFDGFGGGWLYADGTSTAPNSTTVQNGEATFLNTKTGTVSVTGGTLNVDWYVGTHVVDADNTLTDIDTGDNDVTFLEAGDNLAVWKHNGVDWGSAAALQTTGTNVSGDNPQPNNSGAIRIREYSMTASATCPGVGCTLFQYNEQIGWTGGYGEYDYHDDYGENYLTSCLAGSTSSCSDDTSDDDVIGVSWHRSTIGTMNAPLSTVNEPPTNGSWHVGMLEALSFSIDSFSRDYGILLPGSNPTDLTNTLTASSSASHGYVIYARSVQDMTCSNNLICGTATITDWGGTNAIPTAWSGGSFGFGYSTNDYDLQGGTANRFSGPNYAGFIETGFGDPVADRTGPSSDQENVITYRIAPQAVQDAGPYQTSIVYIIVATY